MRAVATDAWGSDWSPHATLSGHKWEVWQLNFTAGVLFSGSFDHTIKRWDMRTLSCSATLRGHKGRGGRRCRPVRAVTEPPPPGYVHAMTIGEAELISGCADRTIKVGACCAAVFA